MCWEYFRWAKDVSFQPRKNTKREYPYPEFLKRLIILSLLPGILSTILFIVGLGATAGFESLGGGSAMLAFFFIPMFVISAIIGPFITALLTHLFGKRVFQLMDGKFKKSYNAAAYSTAPRFLFGWIPVIGPIIGTVWGIIVQAYAMSNQHRIGIRRALLVVLIPIMVIFTIIAFFTIFTLVTLVASIGAGGILF